MDAVNDALNQFWPFLNEIYEIIRAGFYKVNDIRGILIAAAGAYLLHAYPRVWVIVIGCVLAHAIVDVLGPVIVNRAAFRLPPLVEVAYWRELLSLAAGYFILVSVFYLVKRLFARLTGGGGH